FQSAVLGPLNAKPPAPWRLLPPGAPESLPWRAGETALWSETRAAIEARPYLGDEDGSRLLVALPKAGGAPWAVKGLSRLFYADETILTDILHAGISGAGPRELPEWSVRPERDAPLGLFDRTRMEKVALLASNGVLRGGTVFTAQCVPYA